MLTTLSISNYRSLLKLTIPLGPLNLITGPNGSGKSNLYRALRLLAETAQGGVVNALAREGGLDSTFWAGPETLSKRMRNGDAPIQGGPRQKAKRLRLGFASQDFGYSISLGLPPPGNLGPTAFSLDPVIKRECIWAGAFFRPASLLVDRDGPMIKVRSKRSWEVVAQHTSSFDSIFSQIADPANTPEIMQLRGNIQAWRFYDHFRTDSEAPTRLPQLGTRTPVLHHDGRDLAAALQTIREIGDARALDETISDAFPGARLEIAVQQDNRYPDISSTVPTSSPPSVGRTGGRPPVVGWIAPFGRNPTKPRLCCGSTFAAPPWSATKCRVTLRSCPRNVALIYGPWGNPTYKTRIQALHEKQKHEHG